MSPLSRLGAGEGTSPCPHLELELQIQQMRLQPSASIRFYSGTVIDLLTDILRGFFPGGFCGILIISINCTYTPCSLSLASTSWSRRNHLLALDLWAEYLLIHRWINTDNFQVVSDIKHTHKLNQLRAADHRKCVLKYCLN